MSTAPKEPGAEHQLVINHRVDVAPPHLRTGMLEEVDRLRGYSANWDGYGARPFTNEMLEAVKNFLCWLPDNQLARPSRNGDRLLPAVVPMSSGAIQLEWHVENRILELEFETPSIIHYLKWWPQQSIEEEEAYSVADARQSSHLIEWVLSGHDPE